MASPASLRLTFSEGVEPRFSGLSVVGAGTTEVAMGEASLAPGDDTTLIVALPKPLATGSYAVTWHALSADGHVARGTYSFAVGR
jgi:methionine-rich copper-binding protein CopC